MLYNYNVSQKLTQKDIKNILVLYRQNVTVAQISEKLEINIWSVYYQLRLNKNNNRYIRRPITYKDYLHNHMLDLQNQRKRAKGLIRASLTVELKKMNCAKKINKNGNYFIDYLNQ